MPPARNRAPCPFGVRYPNKFLAAKGVTDATAKQRLGIEAGVRSSLENHDGKTVVKVGEGVPHKWRLTG
jgi:hypothetical protein